jgi:hypothetical protein
MCKLEAACTGHRPPTDRSALKPISKLRSSLRWLLVLGAVAIGLTAGVLAVRPWIARKVETGLRERLHQSGLAVTWQSSSWDLWRGQHFTGLCIRQSGGAQLSIAEFGQLNFKLPFAQYIGGSGGTTSCQIESAPLTLHDSDGSVTLDHVSLSLDAGDGKLQIRSLSASQRGLSVDVTGTLLTAPPSSSSASGFQLDLHVLRDVLATLEITPGTGPFHVTGSFSVDSTNPALIWSTRLKGQGSDLEWNGIRCTRATADGEIASTGSRIHYELLTGHGTSRGEVTRGGSEHAPFIFAGSLQDAAGHADTYHCSYLQGLLSLESLKGSADLWELSKDVPALTARRPETIRFKTFPQLEVRNLRRQNRNGEPYVTLESLAVTSKDPVGFTVDGRSFEARDLSVKGAYQDREWIITGSQARLLGGSASLAGRFREGVLRRARIAIEDVRLSDLQRLAGLEAAKTSGLVTASFQGSIALSKQDWEGSGSMRMTNAPVVKVPLLDQVYELFTALLPGVERSEKGEFNANFITHPDFIDVTCFEARGGSSLTVSAVGKIDLRKHHVQGHARGKLVGLPGLVTSPLSRLLEMEISGPYDDIRVKPLGPAKLASNTVNGTVGVAIDTLEETGKITGTILKEGIKLPFKWMGKEEK